MASNDGYTDYSSFKYGRPEPALQPKSRPLNRVQPQGGVVPYDSVDDTGLGDQGRAIRLDQASTLPATYGESAAAGFKESVTYNVFKKLSAPSFTRDPNFSAQDAIKGDQRTAVNRYSGEELDALKESRSVDEYEYNIKQVETYRSNLEAMADHPVIAIGAAITGDTAFIAVPIVGYARLGKTAANTLRIATNISELSAAIYTQNELGQSPINTALVGGFAAIDTAFAVRNLYKTGMMTPTKLSKLESQVASEARDAKAGYRIDPDSPNVPEPTANFVDDISISRTLDNSSGDLRASSTNPLHISLEDTKLNTSNLTKASPADVARANHNLGSVKDIPISRPVALNHVVQYISSKGFKGFNQDMTRILGDAIGDNIQGVKFAFIKSTKGRPYTKIASNGEVTVNVPVPTKLANKGTLSFRQALDNLDKKGIDDLLHESIHAATSNVIRKVEKGLGSEIEKSAVKRLESIREYVNKQLAKPEYKSLRTGNAEYHLSSVDEMLAGIANSPDLRRALTRMPSHIGSENVFRTLTKAIMQALKMRVKASAFTDTVDTLHDLLSGTTEMSKAKAVPKFTAKSLKGLEDAAEAAYRGASIHKEQAAGTALGRAAENFFKNNFMLASQIGQGNKDLSELLFGSPLVYGARQQSVMDYKRLFHSVGSMQAAQVENAIHRAAKDYYGITGLDQFFYRRKYREAVVDLETEFTRYMHAAHDAYVSGREVIEPSDKIAGIVKAHVESKWAKTWLDNIKKSGLVDDAVIEESPYYLPVRYSQDRALYGMSTGKFTSTDIKDMLKGVVDDSFPQLDRSLKTVLVSKWHESLVNKTPRINAAWRTKSSKGSAGELRRALSAAGIDDEVAEYVVNEPQIAKLLRNSTAESNLKRRNRLDYSKEYTTKSGNIMKLDDLIDHDATRLMERYNARMSGRAGFAMLGYKDLSTLASDVDNMRKLVPSNVDVHRWGRFVDDSIDAILGYAPQGEIPDFLRAAGYFSNAMVLKNSGIYGITDMAFAMYELGFSRVLRGMMKGGLWKRFSDDMAQESTLANRMVEVLNGAVKNDMRFKLIHNFAEDNTNLTHVSNYVNVAKNVGSSTHTVNGLRAVHNGMVNLHSGIVWDMFNDLWRTPNIKLVNGVFEATGDSATSLATLRKFGLEDSFLAQMRKQNAVDPTKLFDRATQEHLEIVGQRLMDYLLQQTRLGETSHFASLNVLGRSIVGYLAFSLGTTTRVFARMAANKDYAGMSMLFAYQMPLMLMASYAKAVLDGKTEDITGQSLITDSVVNMGMLGGVGVFLSLFTDQSPRNGLAMLAAPYSVATYLKQLTTGSGGDAQALSRAIPYGQTLVPLRALINNLPKEDD